MSYDIDTDELRYNEKVVIVMDRVCRDKASARAINCECGRSNLYPLLSSPTTYDLCCLLFITNYIKLYRMAGNFGGLLKICHLAEFTLAVEPVL